MVEVENGGGGGEGWCARASAVASACPSFSAEVHHGTGFFLRLFEEQIGASSLEENLADQAVNSRSGGRSHCGPDWEQVSWLTEEWMMDRGSCFQLRTSADCGGTSELTG